MSKYLVAVLLCLFLFGTFVEQSQAEADPGSKVDDEGVRSFYLTIGDYFELKAEQVTAVKKEKISDE